MRTVESFSFGFPTTDGEQVLIVVAKNGEFSHSHYFVHYVNGVHRDLFPSCYQSALERVSCNV